MFYYFLPWASEPSVPAAFVSERHTLLLPVLTAAAASLIVVVSGVSFLALRMNERLFLLCLTLRAFTRRSHMDSIETGLVSSSHENVEIKSSPFGIMVLWHLCLSLVPMLLESPWRANPSTQQQFYTGHNISGLARKREREKERKFLCSSVRKNMFVISCAVERERERERGERERDLRT